MVDIVLGKTIFEDDTESTNNYERDPHYENIRYIPPEYTLDISANALLLNGTFLLTQPPLIKASTSLSTTPSRPTTNASRKKTRMWNN